MIQRNILLTFALALVLLAPLAGCSSDSHEPSQPALARRTILVYMVATNSMGSLDHDDEDLAEMDKAVAAGALGGCRLLVYRVSVDEPQPELFEIVRGKGAVAQHRGLKAYDAAPGSSVTRERMSQVVANVAALAPARSYGLVLWSHASGWAKSLTTKGAVRRREFAIDNGHTMPLDVLASALPAGQFEWIYADVCYFGSIEVAYELRHATRYFVGSPTEIPGTGMPYDVALPYLCQDSTRLVDACQAVYSHYAARSGSEQTMALSLVDCSQLDRLAAVCRQVHASAVPLESTRGLQCYNMGGYRFLFDFMQYEQAIAPPSLQAALGQAYAAAVRYKAATVRIFDTLTIDPVRYSGLSVYIPGTSPGVNETYYKTLQWYRDTY